VILVNSEQFVDRIRIVVRDGAVSEALGVLNSPPGRRPSEELQERSIWYNSLDNDQKRIVSSVVLDAVNRAIFGFLCVIDGVRAIENDEEKGTLELRYVKSDSVLLNPPDGEMLHELW
jgi:hypothetical protein